jgi:hypothetical protein
MRRPVDTRESLPHELVPRTARVRADRLLQASLKGLKMSEAEGNAAEATKYRDLATRARSALDADKDSRILIPGADYALVSKIPVLAAKK